MTTYYGTLFYTRRGEAVQRFELRPGNITLGRAPSNDLILESDDIAPYHARLACTPDGCWITDLGAGYPTFLNQVRLQPNVRQPLHDGDMLRIGPFFIRYARAGADGARPAHPNGGAAHKALPPDVAALLPQASGYHPVTPLPTSTPSPPVRRLRGNGAVRRAQIPQEGSGESTYLQYLAPCYHDDGFFNRFLLIFESVLGPIEQMIDQMHFYFNPHTAPEGLLPWLASWVDVVLNENWSIQRRRELIRHAADLYRWRGTRRGLSEYLRIYTGVEPVILEPGLPGQNDPNALPPHVFGVILEVNDVEQIDRAMIETIIQSQKPAHTTFVLEIRQLASEGVSSSAFEDPASHEP